MFTLKSIFGLVLFGVPGAVISKHIQQGNLPWWVSVFTASAMGLVWGWMASQKVNLIYSSTLYDVVTAVVYVSTFLFLGETFTLSQFWGVVLALVAMILLNQ